MLVMDASAAINMVRCGNGNVFRKMAQTGEKTIAPSLFYAEVAQVAWKYVHTGQLDADNAQEMMNKTLGCIEEFYDLRGLAVEALAEGVRRDHSIYDMLYLVLARRTASPLLTSDRKLARICEEVGVECIELVDFVANADNSNSASSKDQDGSVQ